MTRQVAGELGNGSDPHAARCGCDEARQKRPKKSRTVEIPLGERLRAQWTFEPVEIGCLSKATAMDMSRFVTRPWRPVGVAHAAGSRSHGRRAGFGCWHDRCSGRALRSIR